MSVTLNPPSRTERSDLLVRRPSVRRPRLSARAPVTAMRSAGGRLVVLPAKRTA